MADSSKQLITKMFDPVDKSKRKRRPEFEFERKQTKTRPPRDMNDSVFYKCSLCTAGSASCQLRLERPCTTCGLDMVYICEQCREQSNELPSTCSVCTTRPHLCLSACGYGCTLYEKPTCDCNKGKGALKRLQVKKSGDNHGRYFWSCRVCSFFVFEGDVLHHNDLDTVSLHECHDDEKERQLVMASKTEFPCNMCLYGMIRNGICDDCSPPKAPVVDFRPHLKLLRIQDERLKARVFCKMCSYDNVHGDSCSYCM
jgi:hypothetical protein